MSSLEVQRHNQRVLDSLEPGDLVEFPRGVYSHWAVDIGNEEVVHRTGVHGPMRSGPEHASSVTGKVYDKGIVRKDKFWDVVGDSKAYKNNSNDETFRHWKSAEIVRKASSQIGGVGYNLLSKNCEHFATDCRYGIEVSGQADLLTAVLIAIGIVVGAMAGIGLWCCHSKRDKEKEKQ